MERRGDARRSRAPGCGRCPSIYGAITVKSTANQTYLYGKNFLWFAASFFLLFLASKSLGLTMGYALDDYATLISDKGQMQGFFVSQGRFTFALMQSVMDLSDLKQPQLAGLGFFLSAGGLLLISWVTLAKWLEKDIWLAVAVGALLGAHPFFAEYVSFRQSLFPMGVCFFLTVGAIFLIAQNERATKANLVAACALAAMASGINQIAMEFFCLAVLGISLQKSTHLPPFRALLLAIRNTVLAGAVACAFYLAFSAFAIRMAAVAPDARTSMLGVSDIGARFGDIATLLAAIFAGSHPLIGPVAAMCTAIAVLVVCVRASTAYEPWMQVASGGIVIALGLVFTLLPPSLSGVWWPVPRTLIMLPLAVALGIAILSFGASRVQVRVTSVALLIAVAIFSGKSGWLLENQQRLNRWDIGLARDIVIKISEIKQIDASTPILIHRAKWTYETDPSMPLGDANLSALTSRWAIDPLFEEASGRRLNVTSGAEGDKTCDKSPSFPNSGSIHEVDGALHVCL